MSEMRTAEQVSRDAMEAMNTHGIPPEIQYQSLRALSSSIAKQFRADQPECDEGTHDWIYTSSRRKNDRFAGWYCDLCGKLRARSDGRT